MKIITGVKHSMFSLAYHYGGITIQGKTYILLYDYDILVIEKLKTKLKKHLDSGKSLKEFKDE